MVVVILAVLISIYYFFSDKTKFFISLIVFSILLNSVFSIDFYGANFTYPRIAFIIFPSLQFIQKGLTNMVRFRRYFIMFYVIIFCTVFSQIFSHITQTKDWFYVLDDFFSTVGLFYLFAGNYYFFKRENLGSILIFALNRLVLLSFSVGYVEVILGKSIYAIAGLNGMLNKVYFGSYTVDGTTRIASLFNGTLEFAFFIGFAIIISMYSLKSARVLDVRIAKLNLLLAPLLVVNTYSRSLIGLCVLILLCYAVLNNVRMSRAKLVLFWISVPFVLVLVVSSFNDIFYAASNIFDTRSIDLVTEDSSYRERSRQVDFLVNSIADNGFFLGQGRMNTLRYISLSKNIYSLDSFWIKIWLESGLIAVLLFVVLMLNGINVNFKGLINRSQNKHGIAVFNVTFLVGMLYMSTFSVNQDFRILLIFILFNSVLCFDKRSAVES